MCTGSDVATPKECALCKVVLGNDNIRPNSANSGILSTKPISQPGCFFNRKKKELRKTVNELFSMLNKMSLKHNMQNYRLLMQVNPTITPPPPKKTPPQNITLKSKCGTKYELSCFHFKLGEAYIFPTFKTPAIVNSSQKILAVFL